MDMHVYMLNFVYVVKQKCEIDELCEKIIIMGQTQKNWN